LQKRYGSWRTKEELKKYIDNLFHTSLEKDWNNIRFDRDGKAIPDWNYSGANRKNPHGVQSYLITRKKQNGEWVYQVDHTLQAQMVFWHEMGHHIHQQMGNTNWAQYKGDISGRTPMENKVHNLHSRVATSRRGVINDGNRNAIYPSKYSYHNYKEWWAENYALYRMGFKIHPMIEKFYKEEGII
jgi:hypothetical protein